LSDARAGRWFDSDLLDPWTEKLISTGAGIVIRRKRFIEEFRPYFKNVYERVTGGREEVDIYYEPYGIDGSELESIESREEVREKYTGLAANMADDEIRRGTTLFGPQKDEIRITINGGLAREYASQGQHKSLLISIKFAEFEYLKDKKNETPVILLDDIFSELDNRRSRLVIDLLKINSAQTFITITESERLKEFMGAGGENRFFGVVDGNVETAENN
jgi:DNA replication and repair protein RecF